ncbi:MAG: hypothetical protein LBE89_07050 [Helicobacteraceae bacterium]|jgi:hypothetical protein|nr:hypothetical protein [Helicobacteraceae bacterium]
MPTISKNSYQPNSRAESLSILDQYRNEITERQYQTLYSAISGMAIEGLFVDSVAIDNMVKVLNGRMTREEYRHKFISQK